MIESMRWRYDDIETFVCVMEAGSITAAAERLNLSKSVVSKRISDLEAALRVQLFQRSTRQVQATEAGEAFYERMVPLLHEIHETADRMSSTGKDSLHGRLRITSPMSFGTLFLGPVIAAFARAHPDLELAVDYDDRPVDLVKGGYDVGIRIGHLKDSSLKARALCECPRVLCCSPDYAAQHGLPGTVADLASHSGIDYAFVHARRFWQFEKLDPPSEVVSVAMRSRIIANNGEAIRDMAVAGLGIASVPIFLVADALRRGELIRVPLDAFQRPYTISAIYPHTHHVSGKVRAFIDHLVHAFGPPLPWEGEASREH
jgi:DNA-binding transcriptional LysR family regulator